MAIEDMIDNLNQDKQQRGENQGKAKSCGRWEAIQKSQGRI